MPPVSDMATPVDFTGIRLVAMLAVKRTGLPLDRFSRLVSPGEAAKLLAPPTPVKTPAGTLDHAEEDKGHTYAEYFHGDQATKFYFDTERYYDEPPTAAEATGYLEEVHRAMQTVVDVLAQVQPDVAYHVAQRHGVIKGGPGGRPSAHKHKLSFRTFVDGVSVVYHEIPRIMQHHPVLRCTLPLWDPTVYKPAEQLLCAINGRKSNEDRRVLSPIPWSSDVEAGVDIDVLRYVASHVDPEWPGPMRCPDDAGSEGHADADTDVFGEGGVADPRILELVALLGEATASDRPKWLNVAIFLKVADGGGDAYLEAWLDFSAKCKDPHKYYGMSDCIKTWKSLMKKGAADGAGGGAGRSGGGTGAGRKALTIGTLRHYARCDDPTGYATWVRGTKGGAGAGRLAVSGAPGCLQPSAESRHLMAEAVATRFATGPLSVVEADGGPGGVFTFADAEGAKITCGAPGRPYWGREVRRDDLFLGCLHKDVRLQGAMSDVCPLAPSAAVDFVMNHSEEGVATVTSVTPNAPVTFTLHRPQHPDAYICTAVPGKEKPVKNKDSIHRLMDRIGGAMERLETPGMWVLNVTNNGTVNITVGGGNACNTSVKTSSDDELSDAWLAVYRALDREEQGKHNIVKDGPDFFLFEERTGTWHVRSAMESSNHMLLAMKTVGSGAFWNGLSEADRKYVGSDRGGKAVFNRSVNAMWIDDFRETLDSVTTVIPFKNGALELGTGTFRPLRWDDYVTQTIGYDYVPAAEVPEEQHAFVRGFFEQVLPLPEERELVLRMLGSALDGKLVNKRFLVLQDHRGGDNGKSMVVKAAEFALGTYCMPNQPAFLCATSHVNPNGHEANTLAYKGKRLAVFDETDPKARFDLAKLKSITGGAPRMAVRGAGAATLTQFRWSAFVLIACNKGCLPQIDASDTAFLNRMVAVPMRAKFRAVAAEAGVEASADVEVTAGVAAGVAADVEPDMEPHSFPMDTSVQDKLLNARMAVMHVLIEGYKSYVSAGATFGALPAGCRELRSAIANDSDPRLEAIDQFVRDNVNFELVRRPDQKGRKVLGFLKRDEIIKKIKIWSAEEAVTAALFREVKASVMKDLVTRAMEARGVQLSERTIVDGMKECNIFAGCGWR